MKPAALLLLAIPLFPIPLAAQPGAEPTDAATRTQAADSVRAVRTARAAQRAFEQLRFRHFGWAQDGGSGGRCDWTIGRFCVWEDGRDEWEPPPEHARVAAGRRDLLVTLAEAHGSVPGDGWIAGQRVHYLLEAGEADSALAAARGCRAETWWCRALEGSVLHATGDAEAAGRAFDAALAAMPERDRREWTDLAPILDDRDARALRRLPPAARDSAEARLWWLADPLWSRPGNDRRTEHLHRLVLDALQERARSPEGWYWASDLRELLLRYGWPVGWERIRTPPGHAGPAGVVAHQEPESWEFLPRLDAVRRGAAVVEADWPLGADRARSRHTPAYAARFDVLRDHQLAVFRRDGRALVVAAFRMDADSFPAVAAVEAALVVARGPGDAPSAGRMTGDSPRGVLGVLADPDSAVVSLEARETGSRRVQRARYGVSLAPAPGAETVSDLLLLDDPAARPETLEEALPLARPGTEVRSEERLAVFWEVYGVARATDTVGVAVALVPLRAGWGRRTMEGLGLAARRGPVRMRFREEAGAEGIAGRSLGLSLPRMPAGEYELEVTVTVPGHAPATTRRRLTVPRAGR